MNICTWMSPRELFSFQIPCSFFPHTHQVSYYVVIASFSAKGLSRPLRIVLKLFHGFLPLFQFSAPHIPVAQALQLLSLSHQVTNMSVPCLRCLSSHHDANLPPGRGRTNTSLTLFVSYLWDHSICEPSQCLGTTALYILSSFLAVYGRGIALGLVILLGSELCLN